MILLLCKFVVELYIMSKEKEIDDLDCKIFFILMCNFKKLFIEIVKELYVFGGMIYVRMKKFEDVGIVQGYNFNVNYEKLGYDIVFFLGIYLDKSLFYEEVLVELVKIFEVVGVYYIIGVYSIFVKIICCDIIYLCDVLYDKIQLIKGIQCIEIFIFFDESIDWLFNIVEDDDDFLFM